MAIVSADIPVLLKCWHPLSCTIGPPTKWRGGCSRTTGPALILAMIAGRPDLCHEQVPLLVFALDGIAAPGGPHRVNIAQPAAAAAAAAAAVQVNASVFGRMAAGGQGKAVFCTWRPCRPAGSSGRSNRLRSPAPTSRVDQHAAIEMATERSAATRLKDLPRGRSCTLRSRPHTCRRGCSTTHQRRQSLAEWQRKHKERQRPSLPHLQS